MYERESREYSRELVAHLLFHVRRLAIDSQQAPFIQERQGLVSEPLGLDDTTRIRISLEPAFRVCFVDRHKVSLQALQFSLHRHHVASELTSANPNEIRARHIFLFSIFIFFYLFFFLIFTSYRENTLPT